MTRQVPLLGRYIAQGGPVLPHTEGSSCPLGWLVWGPACGKHTPLPHELEAICPRCGSWGLDLYCASLSA